MVVMNKQIICSWFFYKLQVIPLIKGKLPVKGKREVRKHANWLKKNRVECKEEEKLPAEKEWERSCSE